MAGSDGAASIAQTARSALDLGYRVSFIHDGISSAFERKWADLLKGFESSAGVQVKMVQMESQDVVNQLKAKKTANKMDIDLVAQDAPKSGLASADLANWRELIDFTAR